MIAVINTSRRPVMMSRLGFTMIEMLSVVVIIGILASVVVPQLDASDDLAADAAARVMMSDLQYAQSQAIATQQMQYVSYTVADSNSSGSYSLYSAMPFTTPVNHPTTGRAFTAKFGSGGEFVNAELSAISLDGTSNTVLAFDELGQPYGCTANGTPVALAAPATLTVKSGQRVLMLSIEPDTGNITLP